MVAPHNCRSISLQIPESMPRNQGVTSKLTLIATKNIQNWEFSLTKLQKQPSFLMNTIGKSDYFKAIFQNVTS